MEQGTVRQTWEEETKLKGFCRKKKKIHFIREFYLSGACSKKLVLQHSQVQYVSKVCLYCRYF